MKKQLMSPVMLILLLITAVAAPVSAQENGSKEKPVGVYTPGNGLKFVSADEKYLLATGMLLQLKYSVYDYRKSGKEEDNEEDEETPEKPPTPDRRPRLHFRPNLLWWMAGYIYTPRLQYSAQITFNDYGATLTDANVTYTFLDELALRVGRFDVPFSRQAMIGDGDLQFIERALATDAFAPGKDTGVALEGQLAGGFLKYSAGVFSGAGLDSVRYSHGVAWNGRLEAATRPDMPYDEADVEYTRPPAAAIGASIYGNRHRTTLNERGLPELEPSGPGYASPGGWLWEAFQAGAFALHDRINVVQWEVDGVFRWRGLFLQSEYFAGRAKAKVSGTTINSRGFYAQGGWTILPRRLEAICRYSFVDPTREQRDDVTDRQAGLNWYFVGHNLKLQAVYTRRIERTPVVERQAQNIYRLQFQIAF